MDKLKNNKNRRLDIVGIITHPTFILLLIYIALNLFFAVGSNRFFKLSNYVNMIKQSTMVMIVGCGCTLLLMTENLDLSVGSNLALTNILYTFLAVFGLPFLGTGPFPMLVAGLVVVIVGALIGVVNGLLVTKLKFESFIATLAMYYVARGIALATVDGQSIRSGIPEGFGAISNGSLFGIPYLFYFIAFFLILFVILQKKTVLGKYAAAIGGNRNAAFFSGINADRIVMILYIISGALAGFAGILTASRIEYGDPRTGSGFEFTVLIALLLGGTPLTGGKGTIVGTMLGALIITVLGNGLNAMDIVKFWQIVFKGIILLGAIVLHSQLRARRRARAIAAGTRG